MNIEIFEVNEEPPVFDDLLLYDEVDDEVLGIDLIVHRDEIDEEEVRTVVDNVDFEVPVILDINDEILPVAIIVGLDDNEGEYDEIEIIEILQRLTGLFVVQEEGQRFYDIDDDELDIEVVELLLLHIVEVDEVVDIMGLELRERVDQYIFDTQLIEVGE